MVRIKDVGKNTIILFFGLIVALLLAEIALRVYPYSCFEIGAVNINAHGFRDNDWNSDANFRIAILGDSFMEALEVSDGDNTPAIMKRVLKTEVMNASSRSFNTVTELFVYKDLIKPFSPDVVILFFYRNDVGDNYCGFLNIIDKKRYACGTISSSKIQLKRNSFSTITKDRESRVFLRRICRSCLLGYKLIQKFLQAQTTEDGGRHHDNKFGTLSSVWNVYLPPVSAEWKKAWNITEKALVDLRNEVEKDGAKLLVVSTPEYIRVSKNWKNEVLTETGLRELPEDFDPYYPLNKLEDIARRNRISLLKLEPSFVSYKNIFRLQYPYYSYRCDGHWNPVGHFLAANTVAKYLIEKDWIPSEKSGHKKDILSKIDKNLRMSPIDILGSEGYRQIYEHGVYGGNSNINKILTTRF